jgi:hypothetical protein
MVPCLRIWHLEIGAGKMCRYFDTDVSPVSFDIFCTDNKRPG